MSQLLGILGKARQPCLLPLYRLFFVYYCKLRLDEIFAVWVLVAPLVCMFSVCLACFISLLFLVDCLSEDAGLSCDLLAGEGGGIIMAW